MSQHHGSSGTSAPAAGSPAAPGWSAWRVVVGFGVVSLAADMVYEGARSITGPLLGVLGASAVVVGLVTGAGEATALVLRLAFGPLADRTGHYWRLTIIGYLVTAVSVPLLAVTPLLGGAGLAVGATLIIVERAGKAIRSPAKSTLLAAAAGGVGRGRGIAVHKALDQIGAFAGPLVVAAVLAVTGVLWPALAVLAIPGALAIGVLLWIRRRVPDPAVYDRPGPATAPGTTGGLGAGLPRRFFLFAAAVALSTAGLVTFGIISFHATQTGLIPLAAAPLLYAAAMASGGVAALASGYLYDRWGGRVLLALPVLAAGVPALALSGQVAMVVVGSLLWGAAVGVQDSTVKALVADLVPAARRATAYGVFAAVQGGAALVGGGVVGLLYEQFRPALLVTLGALQLVALGLLAATLRTRATALRGDTAA